MTSSRSRHPLSRLRNFGVIAHVDAGKTTLTERVLFSCGATHKKGDVDQGNTITDHHTLERQKGITISSAAVRCRWQDHDFQLIDTPGHVDFAIEVERCLRVLDGAVVVLDAVAGVEPQTESVWKKADRYGLPRVVFVNKLDRAGADFGRCVDELHTRLHATAAVVALPWLDGDKVLGIIDVVRLRALRWGPSLEVVDIPPALHDVADEAHAALCAVAADFDDVVLTAVLDQRHAPVDALLAALRKGTLLNKIVPVLCGAARKDVGIEPLLDAIVAYLPSPLDRGAVAGVAVDDDADLLGLAFKVVHDRFGPTTMVRLYAGTLAKGAQVRSAKTGKTLRVGRLGRAFAGVFEDVDVAGAGDIVGLIALSLPLGDTLCAPNREHALEPVVVPVPVMGVAIEPASNADREKLSVALGKLVAEDPSLVVASDGETGQTTLSGQGELHLEVTLAKLSGDHGVTVSASAPRVAFKETLAATVEHGLLWKKQTGGPGQWARVKLRISPAARGAGFVFSDVTRGGAVPKQFALAVKAGVEEAMQRGPGFGHPVVDVEVTLVDGEIHQQESSELAFHLAGRACFLEAAQLAKPLLLEPIMAVDVTVPESFFGAITGDLAQRRGLVRGVDSVGLDRVIHAEVPLATLFGYAGALRSLTQGRGTFTAAPLGLREAPRT